MEIMIDIITNSQRIELMDQQASYETKNKEVNNVSQVPSKTIHDQAVI